MKLLSIFAFLFLGTSVFAYSPPDEGMWLPMLIEDYNYEEMKKLGCKLTPEQIYSVNNASIKDAIVQLGGFCTAEVISDQGLIITNHHCAYDAIASQSTEEHNYLKDGFWAQSNAEELPIEGLSVTFLVRMEEVTDQIEKVRKESDPESESMAVMDKIESIETNATNDGKYVTEVKEMFEGNAYYLFVYEVYSDIRLVGAPPSSIGKFGGDTDNWMWPRHTGDFSLLRIYANNNNEPALYSKANRPHKPKHFLPVSAKGLSEGDFTMVMGYPGSTDRYLTSYELANLQHTEANMIIDYLDKRIEIMEREMAKSESVEIAFASSRASLSNTLKYYKGQQRGLNKFDLIAKKQRYEQGMQKWINADDKRKEKYGDLFDRFEAYFKEYTGLNKDVTVLNLSLFAPELITPGLALYRAQRAMGSDNERATESALDVLEDQVTEYWSKGGMEMDSSAFYVSVEFHGK